MPRKAKFFLEKREGAMRFCGDLQAKLHAAYVERIADGQIIEMELQPRRHEKTLRQLGYWYGVILPLAVDALREAGYDDLYYSKVAGLEIGVKTSAETVDILFKTLFAASRQLAEVPLKRAMSDDEMGELIDFAAMWLAKNLGAVVPEPEQHS